jgi:DNA modification methylase
MRAMDAESIDAIVSDPPYGLSFMGKGWDHGVPGQDFWIEALRVAKPGAHLLAFGGTRTFHRLTVAIEDAGWEIRDCMMWLYGSGFPKSHDVSKAIDKRGGVIADFTTFRAACLAEMSERGITRKAVGEALGNCMISHYFTAGSQPAVPNLRDYRIIRDLLGLGDRFDFLFLTEAEREILGRQRGTSLAVAPGQGVERSVAILHLTAAATPEASAWQGWGTALKPAYEPIIMARKPLTSTVAANVLKHGTGAINVDGARVGTEGGGTHCINRDEHGKCGGHDNAGQSTSGQTFHGPNTSGGRWPANVLHDGSDEVTGLMGDAARFFYCAKASKADRDEGCDALTTRKQDETRNEGDPGGDNPRNRGAGERSNHHPTVKPTDLMRYLCRLVTPPGGTVLDPFMGSGSTGKAATLEGFSFVGCELQPEYMAIAEARIRHAEGEVEPLLRVRS